MRVIAAYILLSLLSSVHSQENEFYRYSFDYFLKESKNKGLKTFLKDKEEGWIYFMAEKVSEKLIDDYVDWKLTDQNDSIIYGAFSELGVWYQTNDVEYNKLMQLWKHQYYAPFWEIRMTELGFNQKYKFPGNFETNFSKNVYDFTTEKAEFPGGMEQFYYYLSKALRLSKGGGFPVNEASVKVFVSFIIAKDGTIHQVQVLQSPSDQISREITRTIMSMPNWIPARVKGKLVNSKYSMPINIMLN